jgi:hypothetical protein
LAVPRIHSEGFSQDALLVKSRYESCFALNPIPNTGKVSSEGLCPSLHFALNPIPEGKKVLSMDGGVV